MAFTYYTAFTVQSGQVTGTLTDFPVGILESGLARLAVSPGGHVLNSNGYDIRPYADAGLSSALTYQLVYYNSATGALEMYVNVGSLTDSSVIYLAYGDAALNTDGSSTGTWNSNFKAVYHFGDGSTLSLADSTANANTLTNNNTVTATAAPVVGGSGGFASASSQSLTSATPAATALPITMSALIYETDLVANQEVVCMNPTAANQSGVDLQTRAAGTLVRVLQNGGSASSAAISNTTWYHVAGRFVTTTDRNVVVNGTNTQNTTSSALNTPNQISIGAFKTNGASSGFFNGRIDELRISDVDRSVDWITAESNNLRVPSSFYSVGTEQAVGGASAIAVLIGGKLVGGGILLRGLVS